MFFILIESVYLDEITVFIVAKPTPGYADFVTASSNPYTITRADNAANNDNIHTAWWNSQKMFSLSNTRYL